MKHIVTIILVFCIGFLHAQKTEQFFDFAFKPTTGAGRYYVITEEKEGRWYREAFYMPEKSMAMMGWYKDKNCKTADGEVTWFHPNKRIKSKTNYVNGKKYGIVLEYHENGMMRDSSNYLDGRLYGVSLGWNNEGYQVDSSNFDGAGNGFIVHWFPNGPPSSISYWTNDTTRAKRWTYYHPNGKVAATEEYVLGKRTQCNCFDDTGKELNASLCVEEEAYFPGKAEGWKTFLEKNLNANVPVTNRAPEGMYTVLVQFIVDKDGRVTEIKPLTNFGFGMEAEVVRLLKRSPKWIPANQFGRKVKAYRKQPVTFMVSKG